MEKHYKMKWLSPFSKGFMLSLGLLLAGSLAMAGQPLSGTYTINSATATGGTNFQTFKALTDSLDANGVSGAVTVNVVASSGPYSEQVILPEVSGASSKNTITINGNGETVVNTSSSSVFRFDGADYYTLDNIRMDGQGTSNGTRCIHLWKGSDYNTVKNCELVISKYTGTSNSTQYVSFSGSTTSYSSSANHGNYNTFDSNKMWNGKGSTSSAGPYHAIADYRNSGLTSTGFNKYTNNDISNMYYYGIYIYYAGGCQIVGNDIHDQRSGATYSYPVYYYRGQGTATNPILINENELHDIDIDYYCYGIQAYYCTGSSQKTLQMNDNEIYNVTCGYYLYGAVRPYYCTNIEVMRNDVHDNDAGYYVYGVYGYRSVNSNIEGNTIHDNSAFYGVYGFYVYYSDGDMRNNLYYSNSGDYYNYGMLAGYTQTTFNVTHNTFVMNDDVDYYNYGMYAYMYYAFTSMNFKNNIVAMLGDAGGSYQNYVVYSPYNYKDMGWENNDFFIDNNSTNTWYTNGQNTSLSTFASSVGNTTNINVDPKFADLKKGDLTPTNPAIANYGQPGYADIDYDGDSRTKCGPDLGAFEFYIDHNASDLIFTGTNECGGYSEEITFTFNNGSSVDLEDAKAYYSINGGTPVIEEITKINANSSYKYTFESVPEFHEPGTNTIEVGLLCDDNATNNTLTTTIDITPAPHSFDLTEGANFPGYFNGGTSNNPDVTVPGKEVDYDIDNPTKYDNGKYGASSDWNMMVNAWTSGGTSVSTGVTLTTPTSGNQGVLSFDPDPALADSLVYLGITVTDNKTGCDSTFGRWIFVPHTPNVDWAADDACDGDVVAFVNGTKQAVGAVEYSWDFGDPASGTEDNTSTISDPVHRFSTYGTYTVTMNAWNFDYPKFVYTMTKQVAVSPVPTVDFKVTNACEGSDIMFTNTTTLPTGITGVIDYSWDFGDKSAKSTMENPTHQYATPGGYQVTLSASLKGCVSKLTKNANQFATPVADFSVSGKCNLEEIEFANASTIALGNTGYKWDFNDGNVSNLSNPMHAFDMPGSHTVKLTTVSEFGCTDDIEKTFTLNESPRADFSHSDACSETAVSFTREGSLPTGANSIFEWDFDGEKISTKENDSHKFANVGVKKVSLKVSSDNGCSDMIEKEFVVKLQAKADFVANDVCEGDEVVFTNKSEVAAGNLNYSWRFGDAETSPLTSPRHAYELATPGVTESFQVTLLALVPGGCSDSIAKTVTVNAKSDASFNATANWRNLVISNQKTTDPTNIYNWRFGDGGRSNDVTPSYKYLNDEGKYTVCLAIINNAGCISEHCEEVELTTGVDEVSAEDIFSVYPNPNAGVFNVKVNNPESNLNIVIMDATGKTIKNVNADASGIYNIDISDVAAGVYMVQVINGNYSAMQRVTVAN